MNDAERQLSEDRALRGTARGLFDARLAQVRQDLAAKGVGQRAKDRSVESIADAADHAIAVASENRLVVGATVAALLGWFFRRPLVGLFRRGVGDDNGEAIQ